VARAGPSHAARHEFLLRFGDRDPPSLNKTQFLTHDGYSFVTTASHADCELQALLSSNRRHSWQATRRLKLRSVDSTAAPSDNSLLRAVDATAASYMGRELRAVGQAEGT